MYPDYHSVRMDTHHDNLSMQSFLTKYGFKYCGEITLKSGALRRAYEKESKLFFYVLNFPSLSNLNNSSFCLCEPV